jgi:hypothetical protein
MAGISLLCNEFIESESFQRSKTDLKAETGLSDEKIDDRLEALVGHSAGMPKGLLSEFRTEIFGLQS